MEYVIVIEQDPKKLADLVDDQIKKGWKPQGGITFFGSTDIEGGWIWSQAMIREDESAE